MSNINGHKTRISMDASSYDEICVKCGAHDGIGTLGGLARQCSVSDEEYEKWLEEKAAKEEMK